MGRLLPGNSLLWETMSPRGCSAWGVLVSPDIPACWVLGQLANVVMACTSQQDPQPCSWFRLEMLKSAAGCGAESNTSVLQKMFCCFCPRDNSQLANPSGSAKAVPRQGKLSFQALSALLLPPWPVPSTHHFLLQEMAAKETMMAPGHEVFCAKHLFSFYLLSSKCFPTLAHHDTNSALSIYPQLAN